MSIWLRGWGGLRRIRSKHCIGSAVREWPGFSGTEAGKSRGRPITRECEMTYLEGFDIALELLVDDAETEVDLVYLLKVCCSESGDMTPRVS